VLDLGYNLGASRRIAAMYQDAHSSFAKPAGDQSAHAVGRSGDERGLSGQVFQVDSAPWPERPS